MKLVTFQSFGALKMLMEKGYLECEEKYIDLKRMGVTYAWVVEKMNARMTNETNASYPLWCWVRCYNGICPPKHRGEPVEGFDVKIVFHKQKKDVFITDYRRYSFLLNNVYIPDSLQDRDRFHSELEKQGITADELKAYVRRDQFDMHRTDENYLKICEQIRKSFDKCITQDSDILQGCVWRIDLDEIERIEFLGDKNYRYGSLNYVKSNGKRSDWIGAYYQKLQ